MRPNPGHIVINWLIKVSLVIIVVFLIGFEVVGVVVARGTAQDTAREAAQEAGFRFRDTRNFRQAEDEARRYVEKEGVQFISLAVNEQANTSTVSVRKTATTLFIKNIGPLKKYTLVEATESAPITP
jgi:hypothetical protein